MKRTFPILGPDTIFSRFETSVTLDVVNKRFDMSKHFEAGDIRPTPFVDALGERYLSYALSTIMSRSLPDVRDGLKPVHRRMLYAMRELRLDPSSGFKKCARIVGDVMGKYHPHGDAAIYDAMVRLAQGFAVRYPLVDGQGNFGNIDGDNPAAMRYTEARLTEIAKALLEGIGEDAVDFRKLKIVIAEHDYLPKGMILYHRNNAQTTFKFDARETNWNVVAQQLNIFYREFYKPQTPRGWEKIIEPTSTVPPAAPQNRVRQANGRQRNAPRRR